MICTTKWLVSGCIATLISFTANAQSAPAPGNAAGTPPAPRVADCSKAPAEAKAMCESYNKAQASCAQSADPTAFHECMEDHMPASDCSKSPFQAQCMAENKAREACKGKRGEERTKCLQEKLPAPKSGADIPPADCSRVTVEQKPMCESYNKALKACSQTRDPQSHQACMEDQRPAMDCAKTPDPALCTGIEKAREACRGKRGQERVQCLQEKMPSMPAPAAMPSGAPAGKAPAR